MEFIIVGIVTLIAIIVLKFIFEYNIKKLKHIAEDEELDNLAKAYPSNIEICKEYLKKLDNETVQIEENNQKYIGTIQKVLIDGTSKTNENTLSGRTDSNKVVVIEADTSYIGKRVDVKITEDCLWYLKGKLANAH